MTKKRMGAYIILGFIGLLPLGAFLILFITQFGVIKGILSMLGCLAIAFGVSYLMSLGVRLLVEDDFDKIKEIEIQIDKEVDEDFEEFKKQMDKARDLARQGKIGGIEVGIVNGKIAVKHLTKEEVKKKVSERKTVKVNNDLKKPVKKVVKSKK